MAGNGVSLGAGAVTKGAAAEQPWPVFRHDLQRTGRTPLIGPATATLAWSFPADTSVYSPVVGADGTIYVHSNGNTGSHLSAVDSSGNAKWSFSVQGAYSSPGIAPDGTIYFGSYDKKLYALTPAGAVKWEFETGGYIYSCPAVDSDGTVYFGSNDGYVYALKPDGQVKWSYYAGYGYRSVDTSPAIGHDGSVYVFATGGDVSAHAILYAISPSGALLWSYETPMGVMGCSAAAIGSDGKIYFGCFDHKLYCLNPGGTLSWTFETGGDIVSSPAIGADGAVYCGSYDKKFYALDPAGSLKFSFSTGGYVYSSAAVGGDGTIYFGSYDGYLYALNSDGTPAWSLDLGVLGTSSPAIGTGGMLYIGSNSGKLYAIGSSPPDQPSNSSPANGVGGIGLTPTLSSSSFTDPDLGDTHAASQWQLRTSSGSFSSPAFDSDTDYTNLTSISVPSDKLTYFTTYYWHVRYQDNHGAWSEWSTETSFTTAASSGDAEPEVPRFLTLPFRDPSITIQQGWIYTFDPAPTAHQGIDYIKGSVDNSSTWESFDVVAAADGVAMQTTGTGYGTLVLVRHSETDGNANNYFTLYAHLGSVDAAIPAKSTWDVNYSTWKTVKRGEVLGRAGSTGVDGHPDWVHLHFEVNRSGYVQNRTDPYDLYSSRNSYPSNTPGCGAKYLWTTDPPATAMAWLIQQQIIEKLPVTVNGQQYFIVVLKKHIDPLTLECTSSSQIWRVYVDRQGNPVSDDDIAKKIGVIDFALQKSATLTQEVQSLSEFNGGLESIRTGLEVLDIAFGVYGDLEDVGDIASVVTKMCEIIESERVILQSVIDMQVALGVSTAEIQNARILISKLDVLKADLRDPAASILPQVIAWVMRKAAGDPLAQARAEMTSYLNTALDSYASAQSIYSQGGVADYDAARRFVESYLAGQPYAQSVTLVGRQILDNVGEMFLWVANDVASLVNPIFNLAEMIKPCWEAAKALNWTVDTTYEIARIRGENMCSTEYQLLDASWLHVRYSLQMSASSSDIQSQIADWRQCQAEASAQAEHVYVDLLDSGGILGGVNWLLDHTENYFKDSIKRFLQSIHSPGELRVYDSLGRVTGVVDGQIREDIPKSLYVDGTVVILSASDSYYSAVVGTGDGPYGLAAVWSNSGVSTSFIAYDIPISVCAVHRYTIDLEALERGEKGVTIQVDSDGDGKFEGSFSADAELTADEFAPATRQAGLPFWIWIIIGIGAAAGVAASLILWRRMAKKSVATG